MSNTRDNVIDSKQKELYEKKENLIKKIHDLPKYKTNLIYNDNSKSFNLRAVNNDELIALRGSECHAYVGTPRHIL